jgi:hypothetical protein
MHTQAPEQILRTSLSSPSEVFLNKLYNTSSILNWVPSASLKALPLTPLPAFPLPEPRTAPTHDVTLAHQLRIELASIKRKVDVEIDAVEGPLRRVHPFKVLLQVLS